MPTASLQRLCIDYIMISHFLKVWIALMSAFVCISNNVFINRHQYPSIGLSVGQTRASILISLI